MKKVVILFLGMGMMFACTNVKESKEYKELEAERDSLLQLSSSANEEVAEMMSVFRLCFSSQLCAVGYFILQ
jgi:hypothetical protein